MDSIEELVRLADSDEELDSFLRTELSSNEGVKVNNGNIFWGSDIFDFLKSEPRHSIANSINESEESQFETHKFEQKTIEEGGEDGELYSLNENTIIVLDFLDEDEEK